MLKLGCTLLNLTNNCLHKSTDARLYSFTKGDKDLLGKNQEDVVGCQSIVFTNKAFLEDTFIRNYTIFCKFIAGIDVAIYTPTGCVRLCPLGHRFRNQ